MKKPVHMDANKFYTIILDKLEELDARAEKLKADPSRSAHEYGCGMSDAIAEITEAADVLGDYDADGNLGVRWYR